MGVEATGMSAPGGARATRADLARRGGGSTRGDVLRISDPATPLGQAVLQGTRLRILALLADPDAVARGGLSLQEVGKRLACSPQNAHHHLRILADVGAVEMLRSEHTQHIPRQFWVSRVRRIEIEPPMDAGGDGPATLPIDLAPAAGSASMN